VWQAIQYVSSGFTFCAFIVAVIAAFLKRRSQDERERIELAPAEDRARLVSKTLEFFDVDTSGLTKQQQFDLAMKQINARVERFRVLAIVVVVIAFLGAGLTAFSISNAAEDHPLKIQKTSADPNFDPGLTAVIDTTAGKLTCQLFPLAAPIGVANFVGLADGTKDWKDPVTHTRNHGVPLYDGTIFHRVIPDFMIQGGDPKGDGTGDPGYKFKNETSSYLKFDGPGRLAYANAGPDTNGSQFFITEVPYPSLDGNYTIFGQCDDASVELVKQIARVARDASDKPYDPITIRHISVVPSEGRGR
jgi:peptidyl-prolyl cis-trans isomerase A (cyclophilin A)